MTLKVQSDRRLVPALEPSERHLLVSLTAPKRRKPRNSAKRVRPGVNVCFVLDRSGSMAGEKLFLAQYAVVRALNGLTKDDRFAIVTFDDQIEVIVDSRKATDEAKREAAVRLQAVDSRGSTALHGGWAQGGDQVKRNLLAKGVNRVLLLTDGLANVGETDPQTLQAFAADLRASSVTTSTFGVGADFDEALLQSVADGGGGHFYFVERPEQIPDFISSELGEMLDTAARKVALDVKYAPGFSVRPLSPVAAKADSPGHTILLLGDLVSGQDVELVLAVDIPAAGDIGAQSTMFFTVSDADGALKADGCSIDFESADQAACAAERPNADVERAVDWLRAAQARQVAVQHNRAGQYGLAQMTIADASARLDRYSDGASAKLQSALAYESAMLAAPTSELDRKAIHFRGANEARRRDAAGRARRNG